MGGDGGSIPGRQDLVRMKKKKEILDKNQELAATWRHCALSHNPLRLPVVACEKGRLFNKEAILEHLLDKGDDNDNEAVNHVRTLKDVKLLNLTPNPAYKDYDKEALIGGDAIDYGNAMFICPVIGMEMNGRWRFVFLWRCGCVVSEKAFQELKSDKCHKCGRDFEMDDVVVLNGNPADSEKMEANMVERREKAKLEKKTKKKRKMEAEENACASAAGTTTSAAGTTTTTMPEIKSETALVDGVPEMKKEKTDSGGKHSFPDSAQGSLHSTSSSSFMGKRKSKEKSLTPHSDKESFGGNDSKSSKSKLKIQDDPTKSELYKSLFTSHKDAINQPKAHWVTMNPGYFR